MAKKKILKVIAGIAAAVAAIIVVAGTAAYLVSQHILHRRLSIPVAAIAIPNDDASVAQGRHIVATRGCAVCHGEDFAGHTVIDNPAVGLFNAPNITRGRGGLKADFSDLDYLRALRHGISSDGRPLVLMPSEDYAPLSDEDLGAVIAYLKTLPPVDRASGPISPGPVIRVMLSLGKMKLAADKIDHSVAHTAAIEPAVTVAYGKYLAASCVGCHGANLSGGKIPGGPPDWPPAANLTPAGRLAQWNEAQFMQTIRTQKRPDGTALNPVMPAAFGQMSDLELKALWSYLRSLPAAPTGVRKA